MNIKIEGYIGTWITESKVAIKDMNGKSRTIEMVYHSSCCEDIPPLFLYKGKVVEELEGYYLLEDIIEDMKNNEWITI